MNYFYILNLGNLQKRVGKNLDSYERDIVRAEVIGEIIKRS